MRLKHMIVTAIMAGMVLVFIIRPLPAQEVSLKEARNISSLSIELAKGKSWEDAKDALANGLERCGTDETNEKSRGLLNFSMGYLLQKQAAEVPEEAQSLLRDSAAFYMRSLSDLPDNQQVLSNLVLVLKQMGQWQHAIWQLKRAAEESRQNRSQYHLQIGDIYLENHESEQALEAYLKAAQYESTRDAPYRRILDIYKDMQPPPLKKILQFSNEQLQKGHAELARNGFEVIMLKAPAGSTGSVEQALLNWTELGATQGWISRDSLTALPDKKKWPDSSLGELWAMMDAETYNPSGGWWEATLVRRHVAAKVLSSLASRQVLNRKPVKAVYVYELAARMCPEIREYQYDELQDREILPMNIAVELAKLYSTHESTDEGDHKFRRLVQELFDDKSMHYARGDLESIQRSHMVLGLIYANEDTWESSWAPANGIFQLSHALETAEKRAERNSALYQPLPHLERKLAEGYMQNGQRGEAFQRYFRAVMGYLETDGLEEAEEAFKNARRLQSAAALETREKLNNLELILKGRKYVKEPNAEILDNSSQNYWRNQEELSWISSTDNLGLEGSFMNRQRFKVTADLGTLAIRAKNNLQALELHTEALNLIKQSPNLASSDDVVRMDRIKDSIVQNVEFEENIKYYESGYALDRRSEYKGGNIWWVPSPSTHMTAQVGVSSDFLIAAEIGNQISKIPDYKPEELRLVVDEGNVTIIPIMDNPALIQTTKATLDKLGNVQTVTIERRRHRR